MAQAEDSAEGGTGEVVERGGGGGILLFPAIGTLFLLLVIGMYLSPNLYLSMGMGLSYSWWNNMALVVLAIMLILTGLMHLMRTPQGATEATTSPPDSEAPEATDETTVEPEEEPEPGIGEERVVEYPQKITGAIYGDVLVRVDKGTKVKVRTLLARSCLLCDHQEKCYKEYGEYVDEDDFLANTECKRYLNKRKQEA